MSYLS